MIRTSIVLPLLALMLSGCISPRARWNEQWYWQRSAVLDKTDVPASFLNAEASDRSLEHSTRCAAVFWLFEHYVRPGFSTSDFARTVGDAAWIDDSLVRPINGLAGWVPVYWDIDESLFEIVLFPDEGRIDSHIYFTLTSPRYRPDPVAFLKGKSPDKYTRLREFALCFAKGGYKRFTKSKVGVLPPIEK